MGMVIDFMVAGGFFMWPILGVSILALAIVIEKYYVLKVTYRTRPKFFHGVLAYLKRGDLKSARGMCYNTTHPLARILVEILNNAGGSKEAVESAAQIAMQRTVPQIQKRTEYLSMFGNVATMLGLLGTIQGLIQSFDSLKDASAAEKAAKLAEGVAVAMNTTFLGLTVGIPCVALYTIILKREDVILQNYSDVTSEAIHVITNGVQADDLAEAQQPPLRRQSKSAMQ